MAIGPVEYIIVGFPGNKFNGEIAPELGKLVESGTIRARTSEDGARRCGRSS
jgi:hypothetical protein